MISTVFSYFIIPLLTLNLARDTDWFSTNFSTLSISMSRQLEFLCWALLTGGYFFFSIRKIIHRRFSFQNVKKESIMLQTAVWAMLVFLLAPYLPSRFPLLSKMHVAGALLASLLLFFCLLSLSWKAYLSFPEYYRGCLIILIFTAAFCASAFLLTGIINSAMEIFFVIAGAFLVRRLLFLEEAQKSRES